MDFNEKDKHLLTKAKDRISFLYIEMARIQQEMKELLARERKSQEKLAAAFEEIGYGIE